jgi:hypothetical protein
MSAVFDLGPNAPTPGHHELFGGQWSDEGKTARDPAWFPANVWYVHAVCVSVRDMWCVGVWVCGCCVVLCVCVWLTAMVYRLVWCLICTVQFESELDTRDYINIYQPRPFRAPYAVLVLVDARGPRGEGAKGIRSHRRFISCP